MSDPDDGLAEGPAGQSGVERARAHLMGGRGPGAGPTDITRHTRGRTELAGQPTAQRRAQLAHQTALARGDVDGLAEQLAVTTGDLGATLAVLRQRIAPVRRGVSRFALVAAVGFALGVAMPGALLVALRLRRR